MSALECYLQALRLDKHHLPSIFNLACNYEQLGNLEASKEQFKHAVAVNPQWPEALYGLSLVCIKLK
jgi:tetratricopeptide (TPR) repeat protein